MKKTLFSLTLILTIFVFAAFAQNELFNKGLQQFDAKQYDQAAITFTQIIAQSPNFYQAHYNLGLCYYNLQRYSEAIPNFQKSVSIKTDYSRAYYQLGNTYLKLKLYNEAILNFNKNLQYEPNNANSHYKLGLVAQETKKFSEAEASFKKSLELNPNLTEARIELGNVYVNLKLFSEAISTFNEAVRAKPDSPDAQLGLGNAYYNNNRFAESIPYYKKASELFPSWATAHLYLADAYHKTKQFSLAVTAYETAITLNKQSADAYYGLGLTYIALKNKPKAQGILPDLRILDPAKANLIQTEISKMTGAAVVPTPVKSTQRIKDESDVAKMADFGFDGAVVTQAGMVRELPKNTGKLLLNVKRGDILSLVSREDENNWFQVVDEKTGAEGWIEGSSVVIKLTNNKVNGPPLLETGAGISSNANPLLVISNLEEKTTLSLRINGTLYKIPPQSTKSISVSPGKMSYYGWSAGIRPATGNSNLEKGRQYSWTFKINRR